MNWYFYRILLPLYGLTALLLGGVIGGRFEIHWGVVAVVWFFLGPIGIGVGYHRLFSHRQFETNRFFELTLAFLGTLAAYAPLMFWVTNHQHHHKTSDLDDDPSSPGRHGFWESFLLYRLRKTTLQKIHTDNHCARKALMDPSLRTLSRNFTKIVWGSVLIVSLFGAEWLLSAYLLPVFLEHLRVNTISSLAHMKLPLSYRNFETADDSQNNLVLGILGMGFGWHNNHHQDERQLNNQNHWWEIDIEGLCAQAIQRRNVNKPRGRSSL